MFQLLLIELQAFIDRYNINILNLILITFTIIMVVFGGLLNLFESHLPGFFQQSLRYGKHKYSGEESTFMSRMEVPKSWFGHFYIFAAIWSILGLSLVLKGLILQTEAPESVLAFLDLVAGGQRRVRVNSTCALVASVLLTMQCIRRFYETNFVQIFSKKSKINLSHYIVGYAHYFCAVLALLANTEGFVRGTQPTSFSFTHISMLQYLCIFIFHFSWKQQYETNMIFVKLRTDPKTGKVITEGHLLPTGGWFNLITSPHMFFEVVMYMVLWGLVPDSNTWCILVVWVLSNQIFNAVLTHKWYKENFRTYPTTRRALIPYLL